ncbi:MAG: hypothetical protein HY661_04725, partial [Betaproteobacteria bacterium]|nr:hypothetical protein [Betaproteobacteria bacterium]
SGAAAPLFGLNDSAPEASYGLGYDRLRILYRDITWVDDDAEVESFWRGLGSEVRHGSP